MKKKFPKALRPSTPAEVQQAAAATEQFGEFIDVDKLVARRFDERVRNPPGGVQRHIVRRYSASDDRDAQ